jgi:flagellar hook-basal body complex protein FliE
MSIEAIAAVSAQLAAAAPVAAPALTAVPPPADLSALASTTDLLAPQGAHAGEGVFDQLVNQLGQIDSGIASSGRAATELALGQTGNLHQVIIGAETTRMQFELAMSMRNRVLEAYQEIMRMQV